MSLSHVNSANGNSQPDLSGKGIQAGDMLLVTVSRKDSTLALSIPAGYGYLPVINRVGSASNDPSKMVVKKIAESAAETSPAWSNAHNVIYDIYRSSTSEVEVGNAVLGNDGGTSNNANFPSLALDNDDGSSWVVCSYGSYTTRYLDAVPNTVKRGEDRNYATNVVAETFDTDGGVTEWTGETVSTPYQKFITSVIEIKEVGSTVVITDTTSPLATNATSTTNGGGFEVQGANSQIQLINDVIEEDMTIGTWSDTTITASIDIESTQLPYGTFPLRVTAHSGQLKASSTTIVPEADNAVVVLTSLAEEGATWPAIPGLEVGGQIRYLAKLRIKSTQTITGFPVETLPDGRLVIGDGSPIPDDTYEIEGRAYSAVDEQWGNLGTLTVVVDQNSVAVYPDISLNITGIPDGTYKTLIRREDTGAIVHNESISYVSGVASFSHEMPESTLYTGYVIDNEVDPLVSATIKGVA